MPFCSNCGTRAHERDVFCGNCGARQPVTTGPFTSAPADPFANVTPRMASVLCYIPLVGWLAAVMVLATRKFRENRNVRFHAFQGLYIFAAWLFVEWAVKPMFQNMPAHVIRIDQILHGMLLGVWIFMIIKARNDEAYPLPVIGELAWRSAEERTD